MMNNIVILILIANIAGVLVLWKRDKSMLYALFSVSLLFLFGMTTFKDMEPEWKKYQRQYVKMLVDKEQDPAKKHDIGKFDIKIRQIWNRELGVTDRCVTCHLGVDNPDMKDAPQPYKYHPAAHTSESGMVIHDFNKVGCTICHQGQGLGTNLEDAHARDIEHWEHPMYATGKFSMVQASCVQCHEELKEKGTDLPGAEMILEGRNFASGQNGLQIECVSCHTINGVGEVVAPDLTNFGESTAHEFEATHNMKHLAGEKTKYNWTLEHFLDPKRVSPADPAHGVEETIMPNFEMTKEQAHQMTVWVHSMKESNIPVKYRYRPEGADAKKRGSLQAQIAGLYTPEEYSKLSSGEKLFLKYNCWVCHTVQGKGGKLAPDLSKVGNRRHEDWMQKHFKDPKSVTKKSFMPTFTLSDEQIGELIAYLKTLQ
ncbi:MAG: c-type cytochrome [Nitrospinae bacterium]|nr:c-type cytochrome [Nitrospinota bacterium]